MNIPSKFTRTAAAKVKPALEKRFFPSVNGISKTANERPIKFVIRTDATHAARALITNLTQTLGEAHANDINAAVKDAYGIWGADALQIFSNHIDYSQYGLSEPKGLEVDLHDPVHLSRSAIEKAHELAKNSNSPFKPLLVSLDDMISLNNDVESQIAFSRLFDTSTGKEVDYVQRPDHEPLDEQLETLKKTVRSMHRENKALARFNATSGADNSNHIDTRVPIVFLEDNVRRAKMLNWIIGQMSKANIFKHARIIGISTCFCNAVEHERTGVIFEDTVVPVVPVIDYGHGLPIDVTTTRDLMFDGFVVNVGGNDLGRLPGIFLDVSERFKIHPDHAVDFCHEVARINRTFCDTIEKRFGVELPIKWFESGTAIAHTQNIPLNTPMKDVMTRIIDAMPSSRVHTFKRTGTRLTPGVK